MTTHLIHTCILAFHYMTISDLKTIILLVKDLHQDDIFQLFAHLQAPSYVLALPYLITNYAQVINPQMYSLLIMFHFVKTTYALYIF